MKCLVAACVLLVALVVSPETKANSQLENEIGFATCVPSEKHAKDPAHVCDYSIKLIKIGQQEYLQLLVNTEKDTKKSAVFQAIDVIRLPTDSNAQLVGATSSPCTFEDNMDETFVALALFKDDEEFSVAIPFAVGIDEDKQKFFVYPDTRYISCENPSFYID